MNIVSQEEGEERERNVKEVHAFDHRVLRCFVSDGDGANDIVCV
jgi:hypothetical protein